MEWNPGSWICPRAALNQIWVMILPPGPPSLNLGRAMVSRWDRDERWPANLESEWLEAIHIGISPGYVNQGAARCVLGIYYTMYYFCTIHIYCYQSHLTFCKCNIDQVRKMPQPVSRDAECRIQCPCPSSLHELRCLRCMVSSLKTTMNKLFFCPV